MLERLLDLIRDYQAAVEEAITHFERHRGLERPQHPQDWISSSLPQTGFIDAEQTLPYFLHGYGCAVRLPSGGVDWDFGLEGQTDGFDAWRLWQFARSRPTAFPEFQEEAVLQAAFAEAKARGYLYASPYILYYLTDAGREALRPDA